MESVLFLDEKTEDGGAWFKTYLPDISKVEKYIHNGMATAWIEIEDGRHITPQQRKFIYAIIDDFATSINSYCDEVLIAYYKGVFKRRMIELEMVNEYFSLSNCSVTTANKMIDLLITTAFDYNIHLRLYTVDLIRDTEHWQYHCIMNRKCCAGSKKGCSDAVHIHHATNLVGMGNNRKKHDHINSTFMALCSNHHQQIDEKGLKWFMNHYHVVPTKLSDKDIKKLRL